MSPLADSLGLCIRQARKAAGLSQENLALKARVDRSYMGRIERGEANITVEMLYQIAHVLDVSPHTLLPDPATVSLSN